MKILVTGGAGFIGSAVLRELIVSTEHTVLNIDNLTYAGNLESLASICVNKRYSFAQIDICDRQALEIVFDDFQPEIVMHLAAESHVDRSIREPSAFIETNIIGTYQLLEVARSHFNSLNDDAKECFRFHHVSTDEVYGDLGGAEGLFTEDSPYCPNSPYSASKASSDHLVRAWHRTYGLPVVLTNCSNNYGPYHFPEKLIPHMILNALSRKPLTIYGQGDQIRDWLYVEDHARALILVATKAAVGETYNIGGHNQKQNIEVVEALCDLLDELHTAKPADLLSYRDLITFVVDRPGHDARYAIDASKIEHDLGWTPKESFETGLRKTVEWYLSNRSWWERVLTADYQHNHLRQAD